MSGIILATVIVGAVGLILGLFLCFFSEKFKVPVDEKEEAVRAALPGNNCGGCGYAGCDGLAAAIAKGEAEVGACPVGGASVTEAIAAIMGVRSGKRQLSVQWTGRLCAGSVYSGWRTQSLLLWMHGIWKLCKGMPV